MALQNGVDVKTVSSMLGHYSAGFTLDTYASMLLEQEINPKIVQKLLGHRDVSTTLGIYTHVVPEVFAGVAAAVDTASQQLMDGTYTPKRSAEAVRAQLQQIDPMLSEDMTVNLKYL